MSAILLQGKSPLGAFIKSPLGARTINSTQQKFIASGQTDLGLSLSIGTGFQRIAAFQYCSLQTTIYQNGSQFSQAITANIHSSQNRIIGTRYFVTGNQTCQRSRLGLQYLMPNLTGLKYATITFGTFSFQGNAGAAYPSVFFGDAVNVFLPIAFIGSGQVGTNSQTIYVSASSMSSYSGALMNIVVGAYNELSDTVPLTGLDQTASSFTYSFSDVAIQLYF